MKKVSKRRVGKPPKKKAPVRVTGGSGHRYDNQIAARLLLDMLMGANRLGERFGKIVRVDWQARDAGWLADDLALTYEPTPGRVCAVGISIKSDQQVNTQGFPTDFVDVAWGQWLGRGTNRAFRQGHDAIALITGELPNEVRSGWNALLTEIIEGTPDRVVARLASKPSEGSQASDLQRRLVESFACPQGYDYVDDMNERVRLLHDVRLLDFDFASPTSRDRDWAIRDCQSVLVSGGRREAEGLWKRLTEIADKKRPVGGSLDLRTLLGELRADFHLRGYPDYSRDWENLLRRSADAMRDIATDIARRLKLRRDSERARVRARLNSVGLCLLVGESGSGKSALAKETASEYPLAIWLDASGLDHESLADFERATDLRNPLLEVLQAAPDRCLIVFDGVERYGERALRILARFVTELVASSPFIHLLLTVQFAMSERKIQQLNAQGVATDLLLPPTIIDRPDDNEISTLLADSRDLQWIALRPELRPLLRNLKLLDWYAHLPSLSSHGVLPQGGLTGIIDQLWAYWTEGPSDGLARSHLLMRLATLEAESLARGVPRTQLETGDQATITSLQKSDLVHIRDERISFAHDLLGDWARMRVLVAEDPTSSSSSQSRAASARWQQAIRLFGQRLLEGRPEGRERWQRSVERVDLENVSASLMRDLFLDAVFLATNASELIDRTWSTLAADNGALLNRMLYRFLHVATLPDPRLGMLVEDRNQAARFEHLMRVPFWPYWAPLLIALHARRKEVARIAPYTAAKVCALWLRTTSEEIVPGVVTPWRQEAAELAVEIAREVQALTTSRYYLGAGDRGVYEALLYAAPVLPEQVVPTCLELAGRRELSPDLMKRALELRQERETARQQNQAERTVSARPIPGALRSPRSRPWPDGPRAKVERKFLEACLGGDPFVALVRGDPEAALEVLLAVSIEEPQDEILGGSSHMPEYGLSFWHEGEPPAYFRGPFLGFLRSAPAQALSFVIRLTNFATRRYTRDGVGLGISANGQEKRWYGDSNVFRWHYDWPLSHEGAQLQSALMALEQWLYEQIDKGENIEPWVGRIMQESESLAFAGLLMDVGKRAPELFGTVLAPLFSTWELWDWDFQVSMLRQTDRQLMGYWGHQPASLVALAQRWHQMPHRTQALVMLDGAIPQTMLGHEQYRSFFEEVRAKWGAALAQFPENEHLQLLLERINPDNYRFEARGNAIVPIDFNWPEAIARRNEEELVKINRRQAMSSLPWRCRSSLDTGTPLSPDHRQRLWDFLQELDRNRDDVSSDEDGLVVRVEDVLCAGIALLLATSREWLFAEQTRMAWCREKLQAAVSNPPAPRPFDSPTAIGDYGWDSFAAECGVRLLTLDSKDGLARQLVSAGVLAFRYSTIARTVVLAARLRAQLGNEFGQMLALAIHWAALRPLQVRSEGTALEPDRAAFETQKQDLITKFSEGKFPHSLPDLRQLNDATRAALDALHEKRFPGSAERTARLHTKQKQSREVLHPARIGLDPDVMKAAFGWVNIRSAASEAERTAWLDTVRQLLTMVLRGVPVVENPMSQKIDGLPSDFDGFVFEVVARTIPYLTPEENPQSLWAGILDRGAPAHEWVERFFWHWFTTGLRAATSGAAFIESWKSMISYALEHDTWDPAKNIAHDLDDAVVELLCFDTRWNAVLQTEDNAGSIGAMRPLFERALQRWANRPKVVAGFAMFVVQPGAKLLLLPGLRWIFEFVREFDAYDWKHGLGEAVIDFLHASWERESTAIAGDKDLKEAFLGLLAILVSRGSAAAIALRDRVVSSLGS